MNLRLAFAAAFALLTVSLHAQNINLKPAQPPRFFPVSPTARAAVWADSVFNTLTPDERVAQLIMVAGYSNRSRAYEDSLAELVRTYKLGGVIFFQGGPVRQARLTNRLQGGSAVPLLVAMDAEWGLAMRLDSTVRLPYQMTLGAMPADRDNLIYDMGADFARQARRLGVQVNFAPSVDVNNNPNNPVINFRSFGENREAVTRKALAYMRGMEDNRIITSIKHFPGHGDTGVDSHFDLPVIPKTRAQLDSLELYPFRALIRAGATGVMISHLSIPALDTTRNLPATLSPRIVTSLLRDDLGFRGLIFSDAMNMQGLTKYYSPGQADALGLQAGMDVLEFSPDVPKAIAEIQRAVQEGRLTQASLNARCLKLLQAKAWVGLDQYRPIALDNLVTDLNQPQSDLIVRKLTEASLTILKNDRAASGGNLLPLQALDTLRIASVSVEGPANGQPTLFQQRLADYTTVDHYTLTSAMPDSVVNRVREQLAGYNLLLVGVHLNNIRPGAKYGLQPKTAALVQNLANTGRAVVTVFGNAYSLDKLPGLDRARAIVLPYQLTNVTEDLSAQLIFGAIGAAGRLPVSVNAQFPVGSGLTVKPLDRMKYTIPEEVGVDSRYLTRQIDSLVTVGQIGRASCRERVCSTV